MQNQDRVRLEKDHRYGRKHDSMGNGGMLGDGVITHWEEVVGDAGQCPERLFLRLVKQLCVLVTHTTHHIRCESPESSACSSYSEAARQVREHLS